MSLAYFAALAGAFGLILGSYGNVLAWRLPRGESTVRPPSHCPHCGARVRARDNLPVLSWLLLRGRCRDCRGSISWRYPALEAATGLLFALTVLRFGVEPRTLYYLLFVFLVVVLAAIDREHLLLPDRLTLGGMLAGLALRPFVPGAPLADGVLGALTGAGLLILIINLWYWLRDQEGMGLGDVNMLAMIGAFLGLSGMLTTLALAVLLGAGVGILLMLARRLKMDSQLPFGLFLAGGALLALFYGDRLVAAYLARW